MWGGGMVRKVRDDGDQDGDGRAKARMSLFRKHTFLFNDHNHNDDDDDDYNWRHRKSSCSQSSQARHFPERVCLMGLPLEGRGPESRRLLSQPRGDHGVHLQGQGDLTKHLRDRLLLIPQRPKQGQARPVILRDLGDEPVQSQRPHTCSLTEFFGSSFEGTGEENHQAIL